MNGIILSLYIAIAFYTDIRYCRIPNRLSLIAAMSGLLYFAFRDGWRGLLHSLVALSTLFIVSFILYLLRAIGAGDVKLFAAIGALMGVEYGLLLFIYALLFAGLIAIIISVKQRKLPERIYFAMMTFFGLLFHRNKRKIIDGISTSPRFPMMWAVLPAFFTVFYECYFKSGI